MSWEGMTDEDLIAEGKRWNAAMPIRQLAERFEQRIQEVVDLQRTIITQAGVRSQTNNELATLKSAVREYRDLARAYRRDVTSLVWKARDRAEDAMFALVQEPKEQP